MEFTARFTQSRETAEAFNRGERAALQAFIDGDGDNAATDGVTAGSVALNASDAWAHGLRADVLLWTGRIEESIAAAETAFRFDPRIRGEIGFDLAFAYYLSGRYREALAMADRQVGRSDAYFAHALRAAALAQLGELEQARLAAQEVRRLQPFFDTKTFGARFVDPALRDKAQEGLRKAGL